MSLIRVILAIFGFALNILDRYNLRLRLLLLLLISGLLNLLILILCGHFSLVVHPEHLVDGRLGYV